jgi:uncharacterized protein (UPF0248 family)
MLPIRDLLNRIRWDREFGKSFFEVGILDHIEQKIIRIPFTKIHFEEHGRLFIHFEDDLGDTLTIPFHRIREVYRDGHLIWQRPD